jgi:hypothetical protein
MTQQLGGRYAVRIALTLAVVLFGRRLSAAAPDDWAEGAPGREDGANHTYYNRGGQLPWRNREGDWRDAEGTQQGNKPLLSLPSSSRRMPSQSNGT